MNTVPTFKGKLQRADNNAIVLSITFKTNFRKIQLQFTANELTKSALEKAVSSADKQLQGDKYELNVVYSGELFEKKSVLSGKSYALNESNDLTESIVLANVINLLLYGDVTKVEVTIIYDKKVRERDLRDSLEKELGLDLYHSIKFKYIEK